MSYLDVAQNAFQWVFDNAETISINRRRVVGQTITRSNHVRTVNRGAQAWRFEVKLPDGMAWDTARPYIEAIDFADKVFSGNVKVNNPGYTDWLNAYRGDSTDITGWTATTPAISSQYFNLTHVEGISSGMTFRQGDWVELTDTITDASFVYSVIEDVEFPETTVITHRPIDMAGPFTLTIAEECNFFVTCTELPAWTIFARNQVSWGGSFIFYEA